MHLIAGTAGWNGQLHAVSRFAAWPSVDRSKLFVQSCLHVTCKDGLRAERYPKRYPKETQIFPKASRVTTWSQNRPNRWWMLVVGRIVKDWILCAGWINLEVSSCEWPKHATTHFLSKRPADWRVNLPKHRGGGPHESHKHGQKHKCTPTRANKDRRGSGSKWTRFKTMRRQR